MLRKNIPGAILIILIVFSFIGVGLYLGIKLNWQAYFKILSIVAVIAFIISAIINTVPSANNKE
jgi:ABC-type siderophore export system fused ATPase/permease subunit